MKKDIIELFFDFVLNKYLITSVENKGKSFYRVIDIMSGKVEFECMQVQYLDKVLFYEHLI